MPTPQPGVLSAGSTHAYFLTFTADGGAERTALNKAIRDIPPQCRLWPRKRRRQGSCVLSASVQNSETGSRRRLVLPGSGRSAPSQPMDESHQRREGIYFCRLPLAVMN